MTRDIEIKQAQEKARMQDTLIMQKINASHRVAFAEKFPGQIEHILRLLTERFQNGLDKRDNVDLDKIDTWKLMPNELNDLASAVYKIYLVKRGLDADSRHIDE
jgi:hypothetical protein